MKQRGLVLAAGVLVLLMTACSSGGQTKEKSEESKVLEASIILPEHIDDQKAILETKVTEGQKAVTDAEVILNVWKKSGEGEKKMIKARHQEDGRYVAETDISDEGVYIVQAMVSADDKEIMPKKQWIWGAISEEEHHQLMQEQEETGHSHGGGHQH